MGPLIRPISSSLQAHVLHLRDPREQIEKAGLYENSPERPSHVDSRLLRPKANAASTTFFSAKTRNFVFRRIVLTTTHTVSILLIIKAGAASTTILRGSEELSLQENSPDDPPTQPTFSCLYR